MHNHLQECRPGAPSAETAIAAAASPEATAGQRAPESRLSLAGSRKGRLGIDVAAARRLSQRSSSLGLVPERPFSRFSQPVRLYTMAAHPQQR